MKRVLSIVMLALFAACVGTTGGDVVDFPAAAAGPSDANGALSFDTDRGWHVVLTTAKLHVGAVYLSSNQPVSGAQVTECVLPGTYVAQITSGLDVDLLSSAPQRFTTLGHGTTLDALVGQVWLTGGAIDQPTDATPILTLAGTAARGSDVRAFTAAITISNNRISATTSQLAGSNTICKQRIVSPIPAPIAIRHGGGLVLRIDPRALFANAELADLGKSGAGFVFSDDPSSIDPTSPTYYSQPSNNLYQNLHAGTGLYTFAWDEALR